MLLVLAGVVFGLKVLNVWRAQRPGAIGGHPLWINLLLPVALLCVAVGGLIGGRRPKAQRVLIGVALVFMVGSLVGAFWR